jgi:aspartate/methionine/tyrosine aminotransferase
VLVTTGTSEANFVTAWTLLDPSDRLALMIPNFMQLDGVARAFGADVTHLPLRPELGWRFDFDEVARLLAARPRLVSIVNPHNPSGKIMPREDMARLVGLVEAAGAWLLVDEIYRGAELGNRPETETFWGMSDRVIVTSSTSKSIAHAGLRLGWVVGPAAFVHECMRRQDYTTIGTSPLCQFLGERLLDPDRRPLVLKRSRTILTDNLALFDRWVRARDRGIDYVTPEAGGMVFLRYRHKINSAEMSRRLRAAESVFIVAGDWFGMDGHLRIGIGGEPEKIEEGLMRFDRFLASLP